MFKVGLDKKVVNTFFSSLRAATAEIKYGYKMCSKTEYIIMEHSTIFSPH